MSVTHVNGENFDKEVIQSNVPVIVDFWAEWCGPCKMMAPVFEQISADYTGKLKFAKLNVEEAQDLASEWFIQGIPCLVIVKDGKEFDRIVGFAPKDVLKKKIDALVAKMS